MTHHPDEICDFCRVPEIEWAYPAGPLIIDPELAGGVVSGSVDAWAACAACHRFIERHDEEAFVEYIIETQQRVSGKDVTPERKQVVRAALLRQITAFRAARTGPAMLDEEYRRCYEPDLE